jgi:hypothetical protein
MAPQPHVQSPVTPTSPKAKKLTRSQILMSISLFAVAILASLVIVGMVVGGGSGNSLSSAVKEDQFQAVFLNSQDGQVYFGKLENYNDRFYRLTDIFYVRVEQKIQPEGQASSEQAQQSISLAKLGNELHGPEDEMFITKEHVLFWENLKESGQVVTAIREYKKDPEAANKANEQQQQQQQQQSGSTAPTTNN